MSKGGKEDREWQTAQTKNPGRQYYLLPQLQIYESVNPKLFTDATWKSETNYVGLGWILKSKEDTTILQQACFQKFVQSALIAECLSMREGLRRVLNQSFNRIAVYSDSQLLINIIEKQDPPKELRGLIFDVLRLASLFEEISFYFINCTCNMEADALAKSAVSQLLF